MMYLSLNIYKAGKYCNDSTILSEFKLRYITKTYLFKYTEKFITEKLKIFRQKIQIFFIFLLKT